METKTDKKFIGSVVSINYESLSKLGVSALFMRAYPNVKYPESLGKAMEDGVVFSVKNYGNHVWKAVQWSGINVELLVDGKEKVEEKVEMLPQPVVNKNDLMLEIVKNKDRKLMNKYKDIFSEHELKLLRSKTKKTNA